MSPISVFYQNVRGLRTKTSVFYRNVCVNFYDIICLTETWLIEGISDRELFDDRYIVWRRDRNYSNTKQTLGGGVLIAVRRELVSDLRSEWFSSAEDLWITITLHRKKPRVSYKMHLCVVYICDQKLGHSQAGQLTIFSNNLTDIVQKHPADKFLVLGDFNLPNIIWNPDDDGHSVRPNNIQGHVQVNLFDNFTVCNFSQYNSHVNVNNKILDLVLSNSEVSVAGCGDPLVPEDSHHKALCVSADFVELHTLPALPRVKFMYRSADYTAINHRLSQIDWYSEMSTRAFEDAVSFFYDTLNDLRDSFVPVKTVVPSSKYPLWYKVPLIKILREKAKHHSKFKKYGNQYDHESFVLLRQRAKLVESEMFSCYIKKIEEGIFKTPKAFWSYVKSKNQTNSYPSLLKYRNCTSSNGEVICNMFGDYFYSNFLNTDSSTYGDNGLSNERAQGSNMHLGGITSDIHSVEVSELEVFKLLKGVDLTKSAGPDNIPPIFIFNCAKSLTTPLSLLFKRSLAVGEVPAIWKSALISPIHKKGPRDIVENYRPISKLCLFAKMLEKIVYKQLYATLKLSISDRQHGFLRGRSTTTNLILCSDYLTECMSRRTQVDVIYTDYSKCFDRLDHAILLRKLLAIGISGNLFRWFSSYVANRCQTVVLNGYTSRTMFIPSGIPQGSLLGPLMFNIFINDVSSCFSNSKVLLFADDMKVLSEIVTEEDAELLQLDLDRFQEYCVANRLDLNVSKCYLCTFTRKPKPILYDYKLTNTSISRVNTIRDLGVTFDSKLLFDTHIDKMIKKASKALGFIMRISADFKNIKTFKILYCAFVRSHLEYCSPVWNPVYVTYVNRIESIQRKFLRYIQYRSKIYLPDYHSRCRKFHILPLIERRKIADMAFLFSLANGSTDCSELLGRIGLRVPSFTFRNHDPLYVPSVRCIYRQNSYTIRASRSYNSMCQNVDDLDLFTTSVSKLKKTMCNRFFEDH